MEWTKRYLLPGHAVQHGEIDPWLQANGRAIPDLGYVNLRSVGTERWNPDAGYSPSGLKDDYVTRASSKWLSCRLKDFLLLECTGVMINPARAAVTQVEVLRKGQQIYFTAPSNIAPSRRNGSPRTVCYFISGIVAKSLLRQPMTKPENSLFATPDHRIILWGFKHEFQRALSYLGAVSHHRNLVFDSCFGECLVFKTLPEGYTRAPIMAPFVSEAEPYQHGPSDPTDNTRHFSSYDFPNGLRYDTEVLP
ncbi:hypothetical protein DFP72DRAFT_1082838 [Ephemerocybe angulata]|uniref:Uncharacterized protein n=1 Tax=Ephemerocybe angulata TaxID=980116 RepID=A0A8H6LV63_9AGAR|nr:hypothetical protein DFP72DRAFT_1082838 [Tulosesus angulatus]